MADDSLIFDRPAQRRHRDRAAGGDGSPFFLWHEVRARLLDRLLDVRRQFVSVLDLGGGPAQPTDGWIVTDPSARFISGRALSVAADEELLPFAAAAFDLVLSTLGLHWTNDLPGALAQIRRCLRPDGLFLAALVGGESLHELRECLTLADLETSGGAGPRVSPMADAADLGGLLQRAGLALPVVDAERLTLTYPHAWALMAELRGAGEASALRSRRRGFSRRAMFLRAAELYGERHGTADRRINASIEIIYLTGWAPAPGQSRPLRPGSAETRLADALGTVERAGPAAAAPGRGQRS